MTDIRVPDDLRKCHGKLLSTARRNHCVRVGRLARRLASQFGASPAKAYTAGFLHDIARELGDESLKSMIDETGKTVEIWEESHPLLLHGKVGAVIAGRYGVTDREILEAIEDHVTGRPEMGPTSRVVFAADYLEPKRYFVSSRDRQRILSMDLNHMLMAVLEATSSYLNADEIAKPAVDLYIYLKDYVS